jgi:DNA replication and repair protein RecF
MFKSLRTAAFRNLSDSQTGTYAKDVFLVGENGQGKTNFLEAVYFCSYASSFRGAKDGELCRGGETEFSAYAELSNSSGGGSGLPSFAGCGEILIKYEGLHKSILLDGKKIEDRKDLLEAAPCVVFCHEDMEFVSGSQERRRWFFDQTQSLYDPVYLDDLRRYRRVLKSRNAILRNCRLGFAGRTETENLLDALDPQLVSYGYSLMEKRRKAAERFTGVFSPLYEEVSGIDGIHVVYAPSWKFDAETLGTEGGAGSTQRLTARREADISAGLTMTGPHRDRYIFTRRRTDGEGEFSASASTGQRRLLALLLRVAQARCFSDVSGKTPVLLLDDVLLELDGEKRRRFLSVMPDYEQAFFTFLPEEPYELYRKSDTLVYRVGNGVLEA